MSSQQNTGKRNSLPGTFHNSYQKTCIIAKCHGKEEKLEVLDLLFYATFPCIEIVIFLTSWGLDVGLAAQS